MKILAIETSCDDTGIAILKIPKTKAQSPNFVVLSNTVASQIEVHKPYGGVYPMLAKREHLKNLPIVLKKALKQTNISDPKKQIDLLAVTNGPGLEPCLWAGVNLTKELSKSWEIPIVPVNHIEGHILVNYLENKKIKFPAIALVVSGGHTQLILMKKIGSYKILGETRDDAAGECFDKCAKILGLPYPGGPEIEKLSKKLKDKNSKLKVSLPRPMINTKDYDFSFSGLKTAVLYTWQKMIPARKVSDRTLYGQMQIAMASEVQQAVIDVLLKKTMKAVNGYKAKTLILGGGVSANQELRRQFQKALKTNNSTAVELFMPSANLSTDNAVMTAITAYFHRNKKIATSDVTILKAEANLRIK